MILNGNITASSSSWGAGIGAGRGLISSPSSIANLSIFGGRITANGTLAGIGSGGEGGEVKMLKITGNAVLSCDANFTKFPVHASSIVLTNASLVFITPRNRLFGVSPFRSGLLNLVIVYENVTTQGSELLSNLNATFLQIGNITVPLSNEWTICVSGSGYEDCYPIRSSVMKSLIVTVPIEGNYSIEMISDAESGRLETTERVSSFVVSSPNSFVAEAAFIPHTTATFHATATPHASASQSATPHATASPAATLKYTGTFTISLQSRFVSRKAFLLRIRCFVFATWILP
jgi:hypothetical protein